MLLINQLLLPLNTLGAVADVVRGGIMVLFFISAFMVILVVLAQEGKGGGLAGAFGGAGAETFGVKAGTVNKFTAWLAAAFLGLALLYAGLSSYTSTTKGAPSVSEFETSTTEDADGTSKDTADPAIGPQGGGSAGAESADAEKDGAEKDGVEKEAEGEASKDDAPEDDAPEDDAPKNDDPKDEGK